MRVALNLKKMSKKIVIDKEVFEQKIKGWIERRTYVTSKDFLSLIEGLITEIDTEQSIEERAENKAKIIESEHYYHIVKEAIIQAATEQDLISKARECEFAKWCFLNNFYYLRGVWKHIDFNLRESEYYQKIYTTEELFNQFTN